MKPFIPHQHLGQAPVVDAERQAASGSIEQEWLSYITEMERRCIEASRSAEKQIRQYRDRERERLDALRELEATIAHVASMLSVAELEAQRRLESLGNHITAREQQLRDLDQRIAERERELTQAQHVASSLVAETAAAEARAAILGDEERRARERVLLIRSQGESQLRDYEAKYSALNRRSSAVVAEAAEKVHQLQGVEETLTRKVDLLETKLRSIRESALAHSRSPPSTTALKPSSSRAATATAHGIVESTAPVSVKDSALGMSDISALIAQLEEQFRDSQVEAASADFSRLNATLNPSADASMEA